MNIEELNKEIISCSLCKDVLYKKTLGNGNMQAKYMIIGDAPGYGNGKIENTYGLAWKKGPSSKTLNKALEISGLINDCWLTNLLKCSMICNKPSGEIENNNCNKYLINEINIIKPTILVALGGHVYKTLLNYNINIPLIKVYHPSYVCRFHKNINKYAESFLNKI